MVAAKDIPTLPILEFLWRLKVQQPPSTATHWQDVPSLRPVIPFPKEVPAKVHLAKLDQLARKGLINGCACGCAGAWEITAKGIERLETLRKEVVKC